MCCPRNGKQASQVLRQIVFKTTVPRAWEGGTIRLVSPDTGQNRGKQCGESYRAFVECDLRGGRSDTSLLEHHMKSAPQHRSFSAWQPLALISALAGLAVPAFAQTDTDQKLEPVTVSASRFESNTVPIGATVITAEQIREAGIGSVNEAIRKIGGVYGRQNMSGTSDYQLDLRGFGAFSDQNVVVMIDGIRLSDNEQVTALMSSIPIESIDRIEIVRGGSSVLYGEGATGGTIQIITKRGTRTGTHGSIVGEVGSFDTNDLRASLTRGWDNFSLDANVNSLRTDNYRDNNKLKQENFSGGLQWASQDTRIGMRVDSSRQDARFAGSLSYAQYKADPRQASTPNDWGSFDVDRYTLFGEKRIGNLEFAADLSHRTKTVEFFQFGGLSTYDTKMTQFSPRLRYVTKGTAVSNEIVTGLDFAKSNRVRDASFAQDDATQRSTAIYFRDELKISDARIALGARHEKFKKDTEDTVAFNPSYKASNSLNAWTLEGAYVFPHAISVFAKEGRSYRIPNVDDVFQPTFLDPQISRDSEIGASFGNANTKLLTVKFFRHKLKNEIMFDPTTFSNVNLDPTRRQGIEIEASTRIAAAFKISAIAQHVSAKFTDGPNSGNEVVLVPKNTATLRLNWVPGNGQSGDVGIQWVDSQRYGGDFSNTCSARMPSFATLDARYGVKVGGWEFAISGDNLTDKDYFTQAFGQCQSGIYPDSGRSIKLSARFDF